MTPPAANNSPAPVPSEIQEQVILPWNIAIRITLRGLKIRMGRSVITMSGVVLGIAFLMSVLTGDALKRGLARETRTKTEVTRLVKLVQDEIGTFKGRKIALLVTGPITGEHKKRMIERIAARVDPGAIWVFVSQRRRLAPAPPDLVEQARRRSFHGPAFTITTDFQKFLQDAHLLILLDKQLPQIPDRTLVGGLARMRQPVILDYYHGRYDEKALRKRNDKISYSSLSYRMSPEEKRLAAKRARQARARRLWITVVSMLVTVIGIANAMLMSVTERFREIGTMKCLGALSGFVVKLFLIESFLIGLTGALIGTVLGFLTPFLAYMLSAGALLLLHSTPFLQIGIFALESLLAGTILAIVAAIYPARVAAKMVPADALRTNV